MKQLNIKEYFKTEKEKLRLAVIEHGYGPPSLTIVDATDGDVGNQIYIKKKIEDFESIGWPVQVIRPKDRFDLHHLLNYGLETDCVIVQMPVAERFNFKIEYIPFYFDCDGLTKNALVLPATVRGVIDYLDDCGFIYKGKTAVVLGRSNIVGKPMAKALLDRDMTVSVCHSKTNYKDKEYLLRNADLVICATGQPQSIHREQCESAIVVDVGISRFNGKIVGDFVENENNIIGNAWSTPVPGGVGLLTRLGLMKNCLDLKLYKQ